MAGETEPEINRRSRLSVKRKQPMTPRTAANGRNSDPTKNVGDLVTAESKYQNDMRESSERFMDFAREAESKMQRISLEALGKLQDVKLDSETNRIDQLAAQKQLFDNTIASMLAKSVETTSTLVAQQLLQIQSGADTRLTRLEEFRLTYMGKSSVSDPQITLAISELREGLLGMKNTFERTLSDLSAKQSQAMDVLGKTVAGLVEKNTLHVGGTGALDWVWKAALAVGGLALVALEIFIKHP